MFLCLRPSPFCAGRDCFLVPAVHLLKVEEIARFALDSFSVSQSAELKQYLEQFLGQSRVSG